MVRFLGRAPTARDEGGKARAFFTRMMRNNADKENDVAGCDRACYRLAALMNRLVSFRLSADYEARFFAFFPPKGHVGYSAWNVLFYRLEKFIMRADLRRGNCFTSEIPI